MRINQVDFAALISGALNIPFPTNSLGRFPASIWENQSFAYNSLLANFRQIHEMMSIKKSIIVRKGLLSFSPFPGGDDIHKLVEASYRFAQTQEYENAVGSQRSYIIL